MNPENAIIEDLIAGVLIVPIVSFLNVRFGFEKDSEKKLCATIASMVAALVVGLLRGDFSGRGVLQTAILALATSHRIFDSVIKPLSEK